MLHVPRRSGWRGGFRAVDVTANLSKALWGHPHWAVSGLMTSASSLELGFASC